MFLLSVGFLCGAILVLFTYGSYQLTLIWDEKSKDYKDDGCKLVSIFFWCLFVIGVALLALGCFISIHGISGHFKYGS